MLIVNVFRGGAMRRVIQHVRFATRYAIDLLNMFQTLVMVYDLIKLGELSFFLLIVKLQQFTPDYTAPPPLFHYSGIPMNFRYLSTYPLYTQGFLFCFNKGSLITH